LISAKKCKAGFTIIEVLLSIVIIGIIASVCLPIFTLSAKTNRQTEQTLDSTYLGQNAMEEVYHLSRSIPYEELANHGYTYVKGKYIYSHEYDSGKYLTIEIEKEKENNDLVRVIVKVYDNKDMNKLETQYESLYIWKELGGTSGGEE